MIVLWGPRRDPAIAAVAAAVSAIGFPSEHADVGSRRLELDVGFDGVRMSGTLRTERTTLPLSEVSAIYARPYTAVEMLRGHDPAPPEAAAERAARLDEAFGQWLELTHAVVVNPPRAANGIASKPLQTRALEAAGFLVPETLVTTEPEEAAAFADAFEAVIFKGLGAVRTKVTRFGAADRLRLSAVRSGPVQFQELIAGVDVRVHVVGNQAFGCEVLSSAVDYRYPGADAPRLLPCPLPDDIAARCVRLTADLGLTLAGIDLRRTPDGRWYCFEANTSPAFSYYDRAAGAPIATALARLLASAAREELVA